MTVVRVDQESPFIRGTLLASKWNEVERKLLSTTTRQGDGYTLDAV